MVGIGIENYMTWVAQKLFLPESDTGDEAVLQGRRKIQIFWAGDRLISFLLFLLCGLWEKMGPCSHCPPNSAGPAYI